MPLAEQELNSPTNRNPVCPDCEGIQPLNLPTEARCDFHAKKHLENLVIVAIAYGLDEFKQILQRHRAKIRMTQRIVEAAARNPTSSDEIMRLLLNHEINEKIKAKENNGGNRYIDSKALFATVTLFNVDIFTIMKSHIWQELLDGLSIHSTPKTASAILKFWTEGGISVPQMQSILRTMSHAHLLLPELLRQRSLTPGFPLTLHLNQDWLIAIVQNTHCGEKMLETVFKFEKEGEGLSAYDDTRITEEVLVHASANRGLSCRPIFTLLSQSRPHSLILTLPILTSITSNPTFADLILNFILVANWGRTITVTEAMVCDLEPGNQFLNYTEKQRIRIKNEALRKIIKLGDEVVFTDGALAKLAGLEDTTLLSELLSREGPPIAIPQDMLEALAGNPNASIDLLQLVLGGHGQSNRITEGVLLAAIENQWSGLEVLRFLVRQRRREVRVTQKMLKAAARQKWGDEILKFLLEVKERGGEME